MARLIHMNGPPGVGKSSLAEAVARRRPLTLVVDIDLLRTHLGRWEDRPESKLAARELAISLIEKHLGSGHEVLVPQFLGRPAFIERLERTALAVGAVFVEVLLDAEPALAVDRFRARRAHLAGQGRLHPEREVADADVESDIAAAVAALADVYSQRPNVHRIDAAGDADHICSELLAVLGRA